MLNADHVAASVPLSGIEPGRRQPEEMCFGMDTQEQHPAVSSALPNTCFSSGVCSGGNKQFDSAVILLFRFPLTYLYIEALSSCLQEIMDALA